MNEQKPVHRFIVPIVAMLVTFSVYVSYPSTLKWIEYVTAFTADAGRQTESHWQVMKLNVRSVLLMIYFFSIYSILFDGW